MSGRPHSAFDVLSSKEVAVPGLHLVEISAALEHFINSTRSGMDISDASKALSLLLSTTSTALSPFSSPHREMTSGRVREVFHRPHGSINGSRDSFKRRTCKESS